MSVATTAALILIALIPLAGFLAFGLASLRERERRAARVSFILAATTPLPFLLAVLLPALARAAILVVLVLLVGLVAFLWKRPLGRVRRGGGRPSRRVDERDTMFARARLRPGTREYDAYYHMRPTLRAGDDRMRDLPGLLSFHAEKPDRAAFASAEGSFALTEALRNSVDGMVNPQRFDRSPLEMTETVKNLARYYGAHSVGVAALRPYHVYTHVGRGTGTWGEPIVLDHRWAIAFTVEMDRELMRWAPEAPVVMESAHQYVESARIAVQLAHAIRELGYPARAHIDGNYRVIAPLVARDAGLGEIGRIGLLMTPDLGPRVRLGVVTTSLSLVADKPSDDLSVIDFCGLCKKCAECCPVKAIPFTDRTPVDDGLRWALDAETCYRYWRVIGTDCGRCMAVCPYSHPDSSMHDMVRGAIRTSEIARKPLLLMDDVFYGRKPKGLTGDPMPPRPRPAQKAK